MAVFRDITTDHWSVPVSDLEVNGDGAASAAVAAAAAEWTELQNRQYRVCPLYDMHGQWKDLQLSRQVVACAPFGGPIAVLDSGAGTVLTRSSSIRMFSAAGMLLSQLTWSSVGGRVVALGWTAELRLVAVVEDGSILQFSLQGEQLPGKIALGTSMSAVTDAVFFGRSGVACVTADQQLLVVPDVEDPEIVTLPDVHLPAGMSCMVGVGPTAAAAPAAAADADEAAVVTATSPAVIVASGTSLLRVDPSGVHNAALSGVGRIERMALSPSGSLLACFASDGMVHVVLVDSLEAVSSFDSQVCAVPDEMSWCGEDAVLVYHRGARSLLLVGPGDGVPLLGWEELLVEEPWNSSSSSIDGVGAGGRDGGGGGRGVGGGLAAWKDDGEDGRVVIVSEMDGARLLSRRRSVLVQRVPDPVVAAFAVGSTAASALLLDAFAQFESKSLKADESVRLLGPSMPAAVEACIDAAAQQVDIASQQTLLSAAVYGRSFCKTFPRDLIRSMCMVLRVLNGIRDADAVGLPLTFAQFKALGINRVITMLLTYHRHLLALRISQFLGLPEGRVLEHWAAAKICAASLYVSDDQLLPVLLNKLQREGKSSHVSYAYIAEVAYSRGRGKLAVSLLQHEVREERVVRLLLRMGQYDAALKKAEESADTDLVFSALFQTQAEVPEDVLFGLLRDRTIARNLFVAHCRQSNVDQLQRFFTVWKRPQNAAELLVQEAVAAAVAAGAADAAEGRRGTGGAGAPAAPAAAAVERWSAAMLKQLEAAAGLYDSTREHSFQSAAVADHVKLVRLQQKLEMLPQMLHPPRSPSSSPRAAGHQEPPHATAVQGRSVSDTILACLASGNVQEAVRVKTEMKVPERRFCWLRLKALTSARDWEGLEKFARERRPPIGFRPFAEVCMAAGAAEEAAKYVAKLSDVGEREELYRRLGVANPVAAARAPQEGSADGIFGSLRSTLAGTAGQMGVPAGAAVAASSAASSIFRSFTFANPQAPKT